MSHAAELARRIVVQHRETGFLRLALPAELCADGPAQALERELPLQPGITGVTLDRGWQRLSLRYDPTRLSTAEAARTLFGRLAALPAPAAADAAAPDPAAAAPGNPLAGGLQPLLDRLRRLLPAADALPAESLGGRLLPLAEAALTEKAILNFFNDIVAFYLVKVHWDLITKRWLREPLAHGNAWLATFYLIFLLIRYRKSGR